MRIALVSCGASKRAVPSPAWALYTGSLFVAARRDVEARELPYWIVSAKHGLVNPSTRLDPYDFRVEQIPKDERAAWARDVVAQLAAVQPLAGAVVELHAGGEYAGHLMGPLVRAGAALVERVPAANPPLGARLAWYADRAAAREAGPSPVESFALLELVRWEPDNEDDPTATTAEARIRWMGRAPKRGDVCVLADDGGLHIEPARNPAARGAFVAKGRGWRFLARAAAPARSTVDVGPVLAAIARSPDFANEPRLPRLLPAIAEAVRAELPEPTQHIGRIWRYRFSQRTIEGEGVIGQITEILVAGVGRCFVREAIDKSGGFEVSSGERWGWKHGRISKHRQVLQLAAPSWAWEAVAAAVTTLDAHHRRVLHDRAWTLDVARHTRPLTFPR